MANFTNKDSNTNTIQQPIDFNNTITDDSNGKYPINSSNVSQDSKIPFVRFFRNEGRQKGLVFIFVPVFMTLLGQAFGPILILVMLTGPMLLASFIYGLILFFRNDTYAPNETNSKNTYKKSIIMFIAALVLLLLAFGTVMDIRNTNGYSGGESEIVAFPLILSAVILIILSVLNLLITFLADLIAKRKYK